MHGNFSCILIGLRQQNRFLFLFQLTSVVQNIQFSKSTAAGELRARPQNLIEANVDANRTRRDFVADEVLQMVWDRVYEGKLKPVVGVYI